MKFNYCEETIWEENWQRDYKYGVILFIPPEPLFSTVNELRKTHDPKSALSCCPHISLTMPLKKPITSNEIDMINSTLQTIPSFRVKYGPVINFLPNANGIVFNIDNQNQFQDLYRTIEEIPGLEFHDRKWPFKAHLTIAEFINEVETRRLTESLNNSLSSDILFGEFPCEKVVYMIPDEKFEFKESYTFKLNTVTKII